MIIVHAFHHYSPVIGGMEKAVQHLAETQAKMGHEVHVVTSTFGAEERPKEEVINGVYVHRLKSTRLHFPDLTIPKDIPITLIRRADILHAHAHNSLFSQTLLHHASRQGVKTACYFMAVGALGDHPNPLIRTLAPLYDKRNTTKALKAAQLHLVKNLRDYTTLQKKYNTTPTILPDGIPKTLLEKKREDTQRFLEKYKIRHEKLFIYIGRIHHLKGPHVLVQALKYLPPDIAAILAGPDNGYLQKVLQIAKKIGVADRVYYLGYIDEEDKIRAIDASVALVVPSISNYVEAYSIALSEAWAREKPVIATKVGALPYRVKHGTNGLLVEPGDPKTLAQAMLKLATDTNYAEKLGKNGKHEIHDWDQIAEKSIALYRRI